MLGLRDPVSGLAKARTSYGRPDWACVVSQFVSQLHRDQLIEPRGRPLEVGVFVCGTPSMAQGVRAACQAVASGAIAGGRVKITVQREQY